MADLAEIVPLAVHTTYSFVFHPCELVPGFPVPRFPPLWFGTGFSSSVFSTPVFLTVPGFPVSRFQSPHAPLKAMLTKISKWSRIQDSFRITPKIEWLVVFVIPDIPRKFQKDPSITWVILLTHRQTERQTKSGKNITSFAKVKINSQIYRLFVTQPTVLKHRWCYCYRGLMLIN